MMSVSVAGNPKNRCRTTVAERMVETELPFIGHQVLQERLVRENPALNKPFLRKTINCVLTYMHFVNITKCLKAVRVSQGRAI